MKKQILFIVSILISTMSFAQIAIIDVDGNDVAGTVVDVLYDIEDDHLESDFKTKNTSDASKTYNMKRYELEYIEGTQEYYCWTLCLGPVNAGTDYFSIFPEAAGLLTLAADGEGVYGAPAFHFKPNENLGEATYRYVIFDVNDINDSAYVDIHYFGGAVGIDSYDNSALSDVYPNPANDVVSITMNQNIENAQFEIYTLVGTKVIAEQISNRNGKVSLDVSMLTPGIYMLQEMKSQLTRKFIISR
jgi:hypothetical protein